MKKGGERWTGGVIEAQLMQRLLVKEFGIHPENNGEPLMSFRQWRNITCMLVNITDNVKNGFEVVKSGGFLEHSQES